MSIWHLPLAGLVLATFGVSLERLIALYVRWPADARCVVRALRGGGADAGAHAREVATRLRGTLAGAALELLGAAPDAAVPVAAREAILTAKAEVATRLDAVQALGRISTISGFSLALVELVRLYAGHRGIAGLQAGLAEALAIERGALAIALGSGGALWANAAHRALRSQALRLIHDVDDILEVAVDLRRDARASPDPSSGGRKVSPTSNPL